MPRTLEMNECIGWWGYISRYSGYGVVHKYGKYWRAHRHIWEECFGWIPEGMHVLHACDHPSCVNPEHLFLGTHQANMADRDAKGRTARGSRLRDAMPKRKLDWWDVKCVRRLYAGGKRIGEIASLFPVTRHQISHIVHNRQWREDD